MQLPTLTITREEAKLEVERYRRARVSITLTREDERMLRAYREIARGHEVIDLHRALELGGTTMQTVVGLSRYNARGPQITEIDVELPRLAAFRADKRWAWTDGIARDGTVTFRDTMARRPGGSVERAPIGELRLQAVGLFARDDARDQLGRDWREPAFRALLPTVPPHLRPTRNRGRAISGVWVMERVPVDLKGFVVLWEAEWELDRTVPPGDPALLQHIGGTLYAVLAKWDLTPVEQAVLAGRRPTAAEIGER